MIRIGIIGAGDKAAEHARYFADCPRSRVAAVYDPDHARAERLAASAGAAAVRDCRHVLDDADAVVIASPNHLHAEQAVMAARAARHVFCEKPMGLSLSDARRIRQAVASAQVACQIGFAVSFTPVMQTLLTLHRAGGLGSLVSIWSRRLFHMDSATAPPWRVDPARSGGLLYEISIHELEWMLRLGGPVRQVYARMLAADSTPRGGHDHLWVHLDLAAGAVATHEGSWASAAVNFYRGAYGACGSATTDEWGAKLHVCLNGQNRREVPLGPGLDLRANFLDCIEGKAEPVAGADWGLYVMSVAQAVVESAESAMAVEVESTSGQQPERRQCESLIMR